LKRNCIRLEKFVHEIEKLCKKRAAVFEKKEIKRIIQLRKMVACSDLDFTL
tara:strand:+ start:218 stop:370 length:153 start_codon:yes stop_codon:yes gene_type:complete